MIVAVDGEKPSKAGAFRPITPGSGDVMKPVHCLAVLPFAAFYGGGWLADHLPLHRLAGMPFLMGWNVIWLLLTSLIMLVMFRVDGRHGHDVRGEAADQHGAAS